MGHLYDHARRLRLMLFIQHYFSRSEFSRSQTQLSAQANSAFSSSQRAICVRTTTMNASSFKVETSTLPFSVYLPMIPFDSAEPENRGTKNVCFAPKYRVPDSSALAQSSFGRTDGAHRPCVPTYALVSSLVALEQKDSFPLRPKLSSSRLSHNSSRLQA